MFKYRIYSVILVVLLILFGFFVYFSEVKPNSFVGKFPFRLGLDLNGGTQLVYKADVSKTDPSEISGAMESLRDVIERRINIFGVSEPIVQTETAGVFSESADQNRLIVELPGVTDIKEAVALIGQTPLLEFKLISKDAESLTPEELEGKPFSDVFVSTGLTGSLLRRAQLEFVPPSNEPTVLLTFNDEGKELFAKITRENKDKILAIFLDGSPISTPVIREEIDDGKAVISGNFTAEEARTLVRDLNYGALPLPIELLSTQSIGASLGNQALNAGIMAGVWGFLAVVLFLILWYRVPGFVASISLIMYVLVSLFLFKLIPVTLSAAGLAGFILSVGMAVDANVLIFERMKEERKNNKNIIDSTKEGFTRAWSSIRDSNISSIITAIVLFWLGTSSVKGFALTFGLGVLVSMFTALTVSRTWLFAVTPSKEGRVSKFLFGSGLMR